MSNTDVSDLSIVGTCDILVYQKHHKVMLYTRLVDLVLYQLCHHVSLKNVDNIIILSLNTIIPTIVMVWLSKVA